MIFGMAIGMLVAGVMTLVTGKFTLTKTRALTGLMARNLAYIFFLPIPLAGAAEGFVHADFVNKGKKVGDDPAFRWTVIGVQGAVVLACFAIPYGLAWYLVLEEEKKAREEHASAVTEPSGEADGHATRAGRPPGEENGARAGQPPSPAPGVRPSRDAPAVCLGTCPHCGHAIDGRHYDRLPPWCPACGRDMKR